MVKLILMFLVGEFLKSTLHRYIPSSFSCKSWIDRWAGSDIVWKYKRSPHVDDLFASVEGLSRTSYLSRKMNLIIIITTTIWRKFCAREYALYAE